jgi:hypothetical protein
MKGDLTGAWAVCPKIADSHEELSKFSANPTSEFLAPVE